MKKNFKKLLLIMFAVLLVMPFGTYKAEEYENHDYYSYDDCKESLIDFIELYRLYSSEDEEEMLQLLDSMFSFDDENQVIKINAPEDDETIENFAPIGELEFVSRDPEGPKERVVLNIYEDAKDDILASTVAASASVVFTNSIFYMIDYRAYFDYVTAASAGEESFKFDFEIDTYSIKVNEYEITLNIGELYDLYEKYPGTPEFVPTMNLEKIDSTSIEISMHIPEESEYNDANLPIYCSLYISLDGEEYVYYGSGECDQKYPAIIPVQELDPSKKYYFKATSYMRDEYSEALEATTLAKSPTPTSSETPKQETKENPKTGAIVRSCVIVTLLLTGSLGYMYSLKNKKF